MSNFILCIDTSNEHAIVALSHAGKVMAFRQHHQQQDHVAFLQPAILEMMAASGVSFSQIDAVAVSNGPGSYTGLRVGLASAKGLCFALNKPLITLSTLGVMAAAMQPIAAAHTVQDSFLLCPMIDARRMEVFVALYHPNLQIVLPPAPVVLDNLWLSEYLPAHSIYFSGSGAAKWMQMSKHPNALPIENVDITTALCMQAALSFQAGHFADTAYAEPFYCKSFYQPSHN